MLFLFPLFSEHFLLVLQEISYLYHTFCKHDKLVLDVSGSALLLSSVTWCTFLMLIRGDIPHLISLGDVFPLTQSGREYLVVMVVVLAFLAGKEHRCCISLGKDEDRLLSVW